MIGRGPGRSEERYRSLIRLIADKLQQAIVAGKLSPGEKLAADKLAASLNVSGVPLREALRQLASQGYVTFLPNNEIIVSKPSIEDSEDYYMIASVLEGLAARLAAQRAEAEEIARLRELHRLLKEACRKRDLTGYFEANSRFHRFIAEIARNERLYHLVDQLRQEMQKTRLLALRLPERLEFSMREHDEILDAFVKRNPALAEAAAARHLNNHLAALKKVLATAKG
ncbi:MAG TPA: GntR family transcriptional regulator [Candidatus Acidoferrales bacterium]|nr:GntR family transcriptional regulator [Candidatus Acidoferrales bacterium]